ncbi:hypothetical protein HIM_09018 [Hirsutella minnesotensis 3608]|uniref:Tyrosine--tRNA ligase n=1 Tax=Hirsutella minnesotensis 3608 TaxID=1043627 RepID=A0A0F8A3D2_9HYPO|nr:hypothetical protein HIM_09018 [Hirsutella minnesotensis 3608]
MAYRAMPWGLPRVKSCASLRCASQGASASLLNPHRRRGIATSYLVKVERGEREWKERAEKIKSGELPHIWDILEERGFIKDTAGDREKIKEMIRIKRIGAYVGVDPTADSIHLGHLLPFMALFWLWFHGHPSILLLGGATARVGDPIGRDKSREILANAVISRNVTKMHFQLSKLWHNALTMRQKYEYKDDWAAKHHLLNNSMWQQKLTVYDFTKVVARHTRLGPMLSRETVKRRLADGGDGMSLGEFMYPLFQAWDFWHLYSKYGVQLQIGGSDQYGNIVTGIDTVKLMRTTEETADRQETLEWHEQPVGFTVPLMTDSSGTKFGKSEGNAVWLDDFKTSPFDFYGYLVRRTDEEVERLLKLFTFLPLNKIEEIMSEHRADPSKRTAQHHLAFEVSSLVHGSERALQEAMQHQFFFGGKLPSIAKEPSAESGIITPNNAPRSDMLLPRSALKLSPARILYATGLATSVSDGQRLVTAQGAYVAAQPGQNKGLVPGTLNWTPIKMWFPEETEKFVIDGKILILRKGKHNVRIVELVSNEEWDASGKFYPGEPYKGLVRRANQVLKTEEEEEAAKVPKQAEIDLGTPSSVANNSNIKLPTKLEIRKQKKKEKMAKKRALKRERAAKLAEK